MEKVIHQHYVPRMYLNRFGYGNEDDRKISVLKLDTGVILENQRTECFATANYFYDASRDELEKALQDNFELNPELKNSEKMSDVQFVEHALAREEYAVNNMLNELQEDLSKIYVSPNTSLMIMFLHSLAYRTKSFRDRMDEINKRTAEWLNSLCDNLKMDNAVREKVFEENCCTGKDNQLYQIMGVKPVLKTMEMLLENYNWYQGINNTELDFVISDNPAHAVWLGFNDICVPISCNKAIVLRIKDEDSPLISKDMPVDGVIDLSLQSVIAYNTYQMSVGQKFMFGTPKAIKFMKNFWELDKSLRKLHG